MDEPIDKALNRRETADLIQQRRPRDIPGDVQGLVADNGDCGVVHDSLFLQVLKIAAGAAPGPQTPVREV